MTRSNSLRASSLRPSWSARFPAAKRSSARLRRKSVSEGRATEGREPGRLGTWFAYQTATLTVGGSMAKESGVGDGGMKGAGGIKNVRNCLGGAVVAQLLSPTAPAARKHPAAICALMLWLRRFACLSRVRVTDPRGGAWAPLAVIRPEAA